MNLRPTANLVLVLSTLMACATSTPEDQASRLVEKYLNSSSELSSISDARNVYSTTLSALIQRDQSSVQDGEVGKLNFEPLCNCQDTGGIEKVTLNSPSEDSVDLSIQWSSQELPSSITLTFVKESGQWRVDEIRSKDVPSLKLFLSPSPKQQP
ncbi:MAG: DUF3828 domain-containing protein [Limnobacter sp.]|uniref:DUF3828 domain-containing protein n=1 Tax=Limnobacter sp. TaxID=2003368 RepID=UPI0039189CDB